MTQQTPPFSPVLLAGLALRPLPAGLFTPLFSKGLDLVADNHPDLCEKLGALDVPPVFLVRPTDIPFCFLLDFTDGIADIELYKRPPEDVDITATITGSLGALICLLEGRTDGDALFFSRELSVEGDTTAVVALRNALDNAEIDLVDELSGHLGPMSGPARRLADVLLVVYNAVAEDMETVRRSILAPALQEKGYGNEESVKDEPILPVGAESSTRKKTKKGTRKRKAPAKD